MFDSTESTKKHIATFQNYIAVIFNKIAGRHDGHDASKLLPPEKEIFDKVTPLLAKFTYGSDEYNATLVEMKEALDHHYANNRHHPEHFKGTTICQEGQPDEVIGAGMQGMTLVDLIEMFCDWCAATERHDDGNIGESIIHNMKRFGYGHTLACIMVNTAQEYGMGRRSHLAIFPDIPTESALESENKKLMEENKKLKDSRKFYHDRCAMLQKYQTFMRDPERTLVCDILANCQLLPDPNMERYGNLLSEIDYSIKCPADSTEVIYKNPDRDPIEATPQSTKEGKDLTKAQFAGEMWDMSHDVLYRDATLDDVSTLLSKIAAAEAEAEAPNEKP